MHALRVTGQLTHRAARRPCGRCRSPGTMPPPRASHQLQRALGNRGCGELMQMKLKVGLSSDAFEAEADRVAERVVAMPDPRRTQVAAATSAGVLQRKCAACEEEEQVQRCSCQGEGERPLPERELVQRETMEEEEDQLRPKLQPGATLFPSRRPAPDAEDEELLSPKLLSGHGTALSPGATAGSSRLPFHVESEINAVRAQASPLSPSVRAFFEPRLGYDFSGVRIHHGAQATRAAGAVHARAFTVGRDMVFGAGEYDPSSTRGRLLLAHELTHVVQQGHAPRRNASPLTGSPTSARTSLQRTAAAQAPARAAGRGACCSSALSSGLDSGDYGGIVCCNNVKHSCVWYRNINRRVRNAAARTIVAHCVRVHENTHLNDVDCTGAAVERPGWRADRVANAEECTAYRAEVACYNRRIRNCGDDADCKRDVRRERRFARSQINVLC